MMLVQQSSLLRCDAFSSGSLTLKTKAFTSSKRFRTTRPVTNRHIPKTESLTPGIYLASEEVGTDIRRNMCTVLSSGTTKNFFFFVT